ncbi:MAG: glycerol-3-phosphate dehydrogenase/oxidase [Pseudomonadota bacterium]
MTAGANHTGGPYDLAVIGGGIQGAGVAQAGAAAGHRVLLVERDHWGAGTSSRSTKLIHGGLRYLRNGEFRLVRESLRERRILERIAPHLVWPERFHIPVYRTSRTRPWQLRLGLGLYWALAGGGADSRFTRLEPADWPQLRGLRTDGLEAVFCYPDARTQDRRLTAAVAASAAALGADLACPARLLAAGWQGDRWQIELHGPAGRREVAARILVNCAGPWADQVAGLLSPRPPQPRIELVQGAHLVLSRPAVDRCYYLEVPADGRAVFLLPWEGGSLLGSTETPFSGAPEDARITPEEERYLLRVLHHYFPDAAVEVRERLAGLRVLPAASAAPLRRSREVMLMHSPRRRPNYIAVYGGKLTGYRATAARVLRLAARSLPRRRPRADTARLALPAAD